MLTELLELRKKSLLALLSQDQSTDARSQVRVYLHIPVLKVTMCNVAQMSNFADAVLGSLALVFRVFLSDQPAASASEPIVSSAFHTLLSKATSSSQQTGASCHLHVLCGLIVADLSEWLQFDQLSNSPFLNQALPPSIRCFAPKLKAGVTPLTLNDVNHSTAKVRYEINHDNRIYSCSKQWFSECCALAEPQLTQMFRLVASIDRMCSIRDAILPLRAVCDQPHSYLSLYVRIITAHLRDSYHLSKSVQDDLLALPAVKVGPWDVSRAGTPSIKLVQAAGLVLGKDLLLWQSLFQSAFTSRLQTIFTSFFRSAATMTVERIEACLTLGVLFEFTCPLLYFRSPCLLSHPLGSPTWPSSAGRCSENATSRRSFGTLMRCICSNPCRRPIMCVFVHENASFLQYESNTRSLFRRKIRCLSAGSRTQS